MAMQTMSKEDIGRRARELYDGRIRSLVEPANVGKVIALDIESGDYEVDEAMLPATKRLKRRRPDGVFYALRIGYDAMYALGGATLRRVTR